MKIVGLCNRIIEFSFYAIFLLVPLILAGDTSELFEFNKMWTAFGIGVIIFAAWAVKSIIRGKIEVRRTPLDIPILIFLGALILSTIFSWDRHVSIWGYYTRFNGGLLSMLLYTFFYYAFTSNLLPKSTNGKLPGVIKNSINISIITGVIASLWGILSHFGFDITCFIFRGNFDVACWADDFQPKIRIFSTLGQPDWLAAYLGVLIPISLVMFFQNLGNKLTDKLKFKKLSVSLPIKTNFEIIFYFLTFILFNIALLYTGSRSGTLAVWLTAIAVLVGYSYLNRKKSRVFFLPFLFIAVIFVLTFFVQQPFASLRTFTYAGIMEKINPPPAKTAEQIEAEKPAEFHSGELGGTDSAQIRLLVWEGALNAWKANPIFGTGVETFAFAYYKHKPEGHNLVSEWNFLYNKAHNEFLNYLTTTGLVGFLSYIGLIGYFLFIAGKKIFKDKSSADPLIPLGLVASYGTILATNFFGFSVVMVNIYFYLLPLFTLYLLGLTDGSKFISIPKTNNESDEDQLSAIQMAAIGLVILFSAFCLYTLIKYWNADKAYGYGSNLDRAGLYDQALPYLHKAVDARPGEPVFRDELSINNAILASQLMLSADESNATQAAQTANDLAQNAIKLSDQNIASFPNNYVFFKTRVRIFYALSQIDTSMLSRALEAALKAQELSPNDAAINYNLGIIYGQTGDIDKAIEWLERTIDLKPDYRDAHYALALFYNQKAIDENENVVDRNALEKAKERLKYILSHISKDDVQAQQALQQLEEK